MDSLRKIGYKKFVEAQGWLTLEEAVKHLTETLSAEINEAQILKLALNNDLTLSVYLLSGMMGYPCQVNDAKEDAPLLLSREVKLPSQRKDISYQFETYIIEEGIYDLPMIGRERLTVLYMFLKYMKEPLAEKRLRLTESNLKKVSASLFL